ncbi:MAG: hypothetical protein M0C28_38645 [Candidatus Moduliflexus flocculans]|nr:hypothetical protein [Candidatus Moduliflexus flocculans]
MLAMAVLVISLGLLIALPVWQTEVQREKEEELIFRGRQYAEAVRLYVQKNPGKLPGQPEGAPRQEMHPPALPGPLRPRRRSGTSSWLRARRRPGGNRPRRSWSPRNGSCRPSRTPRSSASSAPRPTSRSRSTTTRRATTSGSSSSARTPRSRPRSSYYGEKD